MLNRRQAIALLASAAPAIRQTFAQSGNDVTLTPGPFKASPESLAGYRIPTWYADAKFGIWSHWGPQSGVEQGDWYARNMYIQGTTQYDYHVKTFGPQSKVGYKDLIPLFKADRWDPDHLMDLYVKAGARYFISMGVHHDNFDMWNSKFQPRWNAVATGPKRDIVGMWAAAARKRNLRFGVSEHLSNSFNWFSPSHLCDSRGPLTGIPYDGTNPEFADLYHDYKGLPADYAAKAERMSREAPERWKRQYFRRIKDLVDQHQPDLLYTDGGIPFNEIGLATVAEVYNLSANKNHGVSEAVYFSKHDKDCEFGTCALDRERGVLEGISQHPWQTDTCIGQWHYQRGAQYKTPKKVVDLLVDIVSKNGNLLLNFPLPNSGELDGNELEVLEGITDWMTVNGDGIFASRPWIVYGEGPSTRANVGGGGFNESKKPDLGPADIRFTSKGEVVYAFLMGWPSGDATIESLGTSSPTKPFKVGAVQLLGREGNLPFVQRTNSLSVKLPQNPTASSHIGVTLRILPA